jgi:CDP-glycerol glycerophosphotransferase (TagB/SpsB family)
MKTAYPIQWFAGIICWVYQKLTKSDPATIVLTAFHGDGYRGNTRVLFESLCSHSLLKPVWLSRNRNIVEQIRNQYGEERAELTHSWRGIKALSKAGALLFTHGTSDFPFMPLPKTALKIQTYHGLPTKRGEYLRPKSDNPPGFIHRKILEYRFKQIDYFLSSSPLVTFVFSERFGIPKERFLETGYPAYDRLITSQKSDKDIKSLFPEAPTSKKLILYAPTYRKLSKTRWFPFDDKDSESLARFLEIEDALFAFRAHPNDHLDTDKYLKLSPRFADASQKNIEDIYSLIPLCDAIITDYSSIYLEGLLKDIPSVFIPYDLESYERGLPLPYHEISPGPKVTSQQELIIRLREALHGNDGYKSKRQRVKSVYFSDTSGLATEKFIRFLEEKLISKSEMKSSINA